MESYINETDREKLEKFFDEGADRVPSEPEYWIHGADEGLSYCLECCKKEVKRLSKENPKEEYSVDGGWDTEGDYTPFCEGCGMLLENTLTDCGCRDEVEHFLLYGFDIKSDTTVEQCQKLSALACGGHLQGNATGMNMTKKALWITLTICISFAKRF